MSTLRTPCVLASIRATDLVADLATVSRRALLCLLLCVSAISISAVMPAAVYAQNSAEPKAAQVGSEAARTGMPAVSPLELYVHTFSYRDAGQAASLIGRRLSPRGTIEVQPGSNTLAVRDIAPVLERVKQTLRDFDQPPSSVRLELRVVKAGPPSVISPPSAGVSDTLPADLLAKLKGLLRYDSYRVLAKAAMTSQEGESVDYSLGPDYSVSFKVGSVQAQGQVRMKDFRIVERLSSDKGRGVEPKELFRADLNVRLDRPFTLVLTRDEERKEALLVALTGRLEPSRPAKPDGR